MAYSEPEEDKLNTLLRMFEPSFAVAVGAALLMAAGCSSSDQSGGTARTESTAKSEAAAKGTDRQSRLIRRQRGPPVKTKATGSGTITVGADKMVRGKITTTGVDGTAAHIHTGASTLR